MKRLEPIKKVIKKMPVLCSIVLTMGIALLLWSAVLIVSFRFEQLSDLLELMTDLLFGTFFLGAFLLYPIVLTLINLAALFIIPKDTVWRKNLKRFEYITLPFGLLCTVICISIMSGLDLMMEAEWSEVLCNNEVHQPVWSQAWPTVIGLCAVGLIGYLMLSLIKMEKMPPLVIVLSMSAMYLGVSQCIMWCIQICSIEYGLLCLYPFNCIIIAIKTIRCKIVEWNELECQKNSSDEEAKVLNFFNRKLQNAVYWPVLAFILMWPLLGILLCILALFGQKPDHVIKAWTETADWRLSQRIAPQNVQYDEHYLCTVAAGGHAALVKPIRMGERHGHRVVVNRQLCIANAFEQILEEKTPGFHRFVRHIYDTYGFPIARLIRTKLAADIVYLLMKPLEWLFLITIYLCDVKPENRIAVQYLPHVNGSER